MVFTACSDNAGKELLPKVPDKLARLNTRGRKDAVSATLCKF
jgi:hypothetical protein